MKSLFRLRLGAAIALSVMANAIAAPTVNLTSPMDGATYGFGGPISVSVTTSVSGIELIAGVEFFVNGISIAYKTVPDSGQGAPPYLNVEWTPASAGIYTFNAIAIDTGGIFTISAPITITVAPIAPPTITLDSPANGTSSTVNLTKVVTATATPDTGGTIASVQFFANGVKIGTDQSFPFSMLWTPTAPGTYALIGVAMDSLGTQATSSPVTVTVGPGSTSLPTVFLTSTPTGSSVTVNTPVFISADADDPDGSVAVVEFFANGQLVGSSASMPYVVAWTPSVAGTYNLTAAVTDNAGNRVTTPTSANLTAIAQVGVVPVRTLYFNNPAVDTPAGGSAPTAPSLARVNVSYGSKLLISADAIDQDGTISNVQFFVNGAQIATDTAAPFYTVYQLNTLSDVAITALVTDSSGNKVYTNPILVATQPSNMAAGSTVTLDSPKTGATYVAGGQIIFNATHNFGNVTPPKIDFYVNGSQFRTVSGAPYQAALGIARPGVYDIHAVVRSGTVTTVSEMARISVTTNNPPSINITSPTNGTTVRVGSGATLTAVAADVDGTVASVQFYANGQAVGAVLSSPPYTTPWTPNSEGTYQITAKAIDSVEGATTSAAVTVNVVAATAGERVFSGTFFPSQTDRFSVLVNGRTATFIGFSTTGAPKSYSFSGIPIDSKGAISLTDSTGRVLIAGSVNDAGATITTLDGTPTLLIGFAFTGSGSSAPTGLYIGSIAGRPASAVTAIVAPDGSMVVHASDGSFQTAGLGSAGSTGPFTNVRFDSSTGVLTGTLNGSNGGSFTAGLASGASLSDGFLRNLSTRAKVGSGGVNALVAGFYVGGTVPKQVLIRAVGPSLASYGITSPLTDPLLQIYKGANIVQTNDDWAGVPSLVVATTQVGGFPLSPLSKDAVMLATLAPGAYTAMVTGVNGATGVGMVEIYDADTLQPFSSKKVINLSTRAMVGPGQDQLNAGFMVSGNAAKKVLIRAAGPGLSGVDSNLASIILADPSLRLVRIMANGSQILVRENDNWEVGNDKTLVAEAVAKVGAFPFAPGSNDAVILISIPPGTYSAVAGGPGTATGVALVEVYEVP